METEKKIETVNDLIEYLQDNCLLYAPIRVEVQVGMHTTSDHVKVRRPERDSGELAYVIVGEYDA